jgi:hypothetical protein
MKEEIVINTDLLRKEILNTQTSGGYQTSLIIEE